MICPVCQSQQYIKYDEDKRRTYYQCLDCSLVFVAREQLLSSADEASRYEAHQNDENDPHYRDYLSGIAKSSLSFLRESAVGLDFGCGKTTLLSKIYAGMGFSVDNYDLYFRAQEEIWTKKFDFIVLSEVIEHLSDPWETMKKLGNCLNSDGQFFIKTKFYPEVPSNFANWFYKRDLTHVQFFNPKSMERLADRLGMKVQQIGQDLYLLNHRMKIHSKIIN